DTLREEHLSYQQLQAYPQTMSPYFFYGENVAGKSDPAHPEAIAVHAMIDGKQATGYIDAARLWLEPPLSRAQSERYMVWAGASYIFLCTAPTNPPLPIVF